MTESEILLKCDNLLWLPQMLYYSNLSDLEIVLNVRHLHADINTYFCKDNTEILYSLKKADSCEYMHNSYGMILPPMWLLNLQRLV